MKDKSIRVKEIWDDWLIYDKDGMSGINPDAPVDVKKAFKVFIIQETKEKALWIFGDDNITFENNEPVLSKNASSVMKDAFDEWIRKRKRFLENC